MTRDGIRIGSIFGIPVSLHPSWFLIAGLVAFALGARAYPDVLPHSSSSVHWTLALVSVVAFFACILIHELAHSLVARAYDIPVKGITLFVFGGVSQITREARRPSHEFIMAIAGPFTSIILAGIFLAAWWFSGLDEGTPLVVMLQWLWLINLLLGFFNLAPGFPMDGGRILRALIWGATGNYRRATRWASSVGRGLAYGLILVGAAAAIQLIPGVDALSGLWFVVIGMFLESAARQSWRQVQLLDQLRRVTVAEIMRRDLPTVPVTASIVEAIGAEPNAWQGVCVFVLEGERVVGVVTGESVAALPKSRWREPVTVAMVPAERATVLDPDADGVTAMETMETHQARHLPVVRGGRLLGSLSRERLVQAALARSRT